MMEFSQISWFVAVRQGSVDVSGPRGSALTRNEFHMTRRAPLLPFREAQLVEDAIQSFEGDEAVVARFSNVVFFGLRWVNS